MHKVRDLADIGNQLRDTLITAMQSYNKTAILNGYSLGFSTKINDSVNASWITTITTEDIGNNNILRFESKLGISVHQSAGGDVASKVQEIDVYGVSGGFVYDALNATISFRSNMYLVDTVITPDDIVRHINYHQNTILEFWEVLESRANGGF